MKKIILLFVVIVLVVAVYFVYSNFLSEPTVVIPTPTPAQVFVTNPSPTPTMPDDNDMKTYSTETFSFKYPSSWTVNNTQGVSGNSQYKFDPSGFSIEVQSGGAYEQLILENDKNAPGRKEITVNGVKTTEYINTQGETTLLPTVILKGPDNNTYVLSMPLTIGSDPTLFESTISGFSFKKL